jgi:hypothetical protein
MEEPDNEEFQEVYNEYIELTNELLEDFNVLMVAAVMSTIGLSLYKTALSEEEYHKVVDAMYDLKNDIATIEKGYLH